MFAGGSYGSFPYASVADARKLWLAGKAVSAAQGKPIDWKTFWELERAGAIVGPMPMYQWLFDNENTVKGLYGGTDLDVHGATLEDGGLKFVRNDGSYAESQQPVDLSTESGKVEIKARIKWEAEPTAIYTIVNLGNQPGSNSSGRFFNWLYLLPDGRLTMQMGTVTGRTAPTLAGDMDSYIGQVVDIRVIVDYSLNSVSLYLNGAFVSEFVSGSAFHPPEPETLYAGCYQGVSNCLNGTIYSLSARPDPLPQLFYPIWIIASGTAAIQGLPASDQASGMALFDVENAGMNTVGHAVDWKTFWQAQSAAFRFQGHPARELMKWVMEAAKAITAAKPVDWTGTGTIIFDVENAEMRVQADGVSMGYAPISAIPDLAVKRSADKLSAQIDILNSANADLVILRGDGYMVQLSEIQSVPVSELPFTNSGLNAEGTYTYRALFRIQGMIDGEPVNIEGEPGGIRTTFGKNQSI